ncbi:DUF5722 domain-containing protein [Paenibacillus sp. GCM10027626]|uniref:DUF5722 domain-containing protein n=1 Tax=Paenibacillus sp. GCM10027626 TaxID=3273411 RepID=UPI00362F1C17
MMSRMRLKRFHSLFRITLASMLLITSSMNSWGEGRAEAGGAAPVPTPNTIKVEQFDTSTVVIDDFETAGSVDNWHAGMNVDNVMVDTHDSWQSFTAYEGTKFLIAQGTPNMPNNVWRTVYRTFSAPLDLSGSRYIMMGLNHRSYYDYAEPYLVKMKAFSGSKSIEGIVEVRNNWWNKIGLDLSGWAGRGAIDKLEISFQHTMDHADHPDAPDSYWPLPEFYIDYVHAENRTVEPTPNTRTVQQFGTPAVIIDDFEMAGSAAKWQAEENVNAVMVDTRDSWNVFAAFEGTKFLIAEGTPNQPNNVWRTVSRTFGEPLDLSDARYLMMAFNHRGYYAYEEPYYARITAYSGSSTIQGIVEVQNNNWNKIGLDLNGWPGRGSIDKLEIGFLHTMDHYNHPNAPDPYWPLPQFYIDYIHAVQSLDGETPIFDYAGTVNSVSVDANTVVVAGTINPEEDITGRTLSLYALKPHQSEAAVKSLAPVATMAVPANRTFTFSIPRYEGERDLYYARFAVALGNPQSPDTPLFVDVPKSAATITFPAQHVFPYPVVSSKKGLEVQMTDDAEELGIRHAVMTLALNYGMLRDGSNPSNTIEYEVEGKTYYFSKSYFEWLDNQIKPLSDQGIIVNLVLVLLDSSDQTLATDVLVHPDAARGQGSIYAFNTASEAGVSHYKAAMEFISERYTREDEQYGRALGYIVGNEVDSQWIWQNMGDKTVDQFVEQYERAVRIAYQAVRKHSSSARVYISLDNGWNEPYIPQPSTRFYKGRDIVDKLNALTKQRGDFPWHVAYHPYPENMLNPDTWNDHLHVKNSFDTPKITFKNLEVLDQYLGQNALKVDGEQRRIILSEQGFNSPDYSASSLAEQAAAYAYAYYKMHFIDGVDSFMLHRHVDYKAQGMQPGLWKWDEAIPELAMNPPGEKKPIYDVFKKIDTSESLAATNFAKAIIGIADWNEIIPGFDPNALDLREEPKVLHMQLNRSAPAGGTGDGFESGTDGWERADNVASVVRTTNNPYTGSGSLEVHFTSLIKQWTGAAKRFPAALNATTTPYLNAAVKLGGTDAADPYYVKVKLYSGDKVAEGSARLDPSQGWQSISLPLTGWSGIAGIDKIKIWASSPANHAWTGTLQIDDVRFTAMNAADSDLVNLDVSASADSLLPAIGSTYTVTVKNQDTVTLQGNVNLRSFGGITFNQDTLNVDGLAPGQSKTVALSVTGYTPPPIGTAMGIELQYRDTVIRETWAVQQDDGMDQIPAGTRLLYNFERSTEGWTAKDNVIVTGAATYFLNQPKRPYLGSYSLIAYASPVEANLWRTVEIVPKQPLNMADASTFFYSINGYKFNGISENYETRVRLYSGSNMLEKVIPVTPNTWNRVELDISQWGYKNHITKIEIGYRSAQGRAAWSGMQFQLDYIGYTTAASAAGEEEKAMKPFWQGNMMNDESVLMISEDGSLPEASLLFAPTNIVSVRNARHDLTYEEGRDWVFSEGKLKLTANSRIPFMTYAQMYPDEEATFETMPKKGGGYVIYREGSYFHDRQINVTYEHAPNVWTGPKPLFADSGLPKTIGKLNARSPLKIAIYGDSIAVGANASGFTGAPPYLGSWSELVKQALEMQYDSSIELVNASLGGANSEWGMQHVQTLVASEHPDLVMIAFGMNDGAGTGVHPSTYKAHIEAMISSVRSANPNAEFVLVGTTLANPETDFLGKQPDYIAELEQIALHGTGIVTADMTNVHQELLQHKRFADMTGNNINHPNDFLSRWYAQFIAGLLIPSV